MSPASNPIVDVIASGIHDTKNVLFDALTRINGAAETLPTGGAAVALLDGARLAVELATERLSTLLSAYRLDRSENPVALLPVVVPDLLDEAVMRFAPRERIAHLSVKFCCECPGLWILDRELIGDCLVNALQNASRHARSQIHIVAQVIDGWLNLRVEDDGEGFAPERLNPAEGIDGTIGSAAGVGLFVARRIAALHRRGERQGRLVLENGGPLGGGIYSLWLPQ